MFNTYIACHECDLIHHLPPLPEGGVSKCIRCGAVLHVYKRNSLDRTLSLTIAGLILFVLSNIYPFLAMKSQGLVQEITLIQGATELYVQDRWVIALLVFLTCIFVPLIQLSGICYILVPMKFNRLPWKLPVVFRFVRKLQPWGMMEVFMLGILVCVVKLGKMAIIVPGIALYSFVALIFVLAGVAASLDPHMVWNKVKLDDG